MWQIAPVYPTLPGFYIYLSYTSISVQRFLKLLPFQLHFPNLNPILFSVYFHESYHAVPSLPVDFQYYRILALYSSNTMNYIPVYYASKPASNISFQYCRPLNSSISLTVSPILLFLFQFLYWRVFYFPNFRLVCFSASTFKIFIFPFQYSSLYYSRTLSIFRLSFFCLKVFRFHAACLNFFFAVFFFLRRHLRDGSRNLSIGRPPSVVLPLPACRQFPLLPT